MNLVEEFRAAFEKRLAEGTEQYHPKDLERVQDDDYLNRVLFIAKNDVKTACKMLAGILKWRKESGASDIHEGNIKMEYVNMALFFPLDARDKSGCRMMLVRCKNYIKGTLDFEEVKKILIYWLDRVEREENGKTVTLVLDVEGAGLQNFEIELIKYLINLFYNYPRFLDQIIIYQMAWILSATFKVVKKLLPPEAADIMKFATKDNILKDFVNPDQALTKWGGTNNYEFKFVPEKKNNKKVSFSSPIDRQISSNSTISTMSDNSTNFTNNTEDELISVEPSDMITFAYEYEELIGRIQITNLEDKTLAFKIRTTGPEKFWVRPCSGIIQAKKTEQITITILPGYEKTALREKFSIMATPSNNQNNLSEVWRAALNSDIEERRLKCHSEDITKNPENNIATNNVTMKPDFAKSLEDLKKDVNDLKTQVTQLKFYQYLSLVLGLMSLFLGYLIYKNVNGVRVRDEL